MLNERKFSYSEYLLLLQLSLLGHGVIVVGNRFLVVGGEDERYIESCVINSYNVFECTNQGTKLKNYYNYPLMTTVSDDFKNCV